MKLKASILALLLIAILISTASFAIDASPSKKLTLRYSVTIPEDLHYRAPAPGAPAAGEKNLRKDGREWLYETDLYLAAHRRGWLDGVAAYMNDRESQDLLRQELGLETTANKDGVRDAKTQLAELEKTFGKPALKAYLSKEGYDHERFQGEYSPSK